MHRIGRTGRAGREGTAITLVEPREHRLLRSIENVTKQKIEVRQIPTVADLRARRLELTRASLRERLLQGDLDDVRVVIQSLADEFDVVDIAAAAVKLAQADGRGDDEVEIREPRRPERVAPGSDRDRAERSPRPPRRAIEMTRIFIAAGRQAGVRPADLVGAVAGEAGISSSELGAIEIAEHFALIEVPEERADEIIAALKRGTVRGQKVQVRRDRDDRRGSRFEGPRRSRS